MKVTRLFDILEYQLKQGPLEDALVSKKNGIWEKTSSQSYYDQVNKLSRGLLKMGVKSGDKVGLVTTNNCTEWNIVDMGLQQIGAISVPLYPTLSPEDYEYVLNSAEVKYCVVSDKSLYDRVSEVKDKVPTLASIYSFDKIEGVNNWTEILKVGEDTSNQKEVEEIKKTITADDLVTIIYTSGTTGKPKGVLLTHDNIFSNVVGCLVIMDELSLPKHPRALSFLPVNHVFERMLIYLYQYRSVAIYYAESIDKLGDNLKEIKPHVVTVVPRLVEKVYEKIHSTAVTIGGIKTTIFFWAVNLIKNYEAYKPKGFFWNLQYKIADALVFKKWREGVGNNIVCMVSGSAALSPRLNRLFWGAGIPILEGYGLTETSPVIAVNGKSKEGYAVGTVGKPISNMQVKLAEDGEILVKGDGVFKGYYKDDVLTKEAFTEDGYFKTGDIGEFQGELLKITDRKKEMFKTSGGKYIAPQMIENSFKRSQFIEQIMVVGEGEKMACAIIQPNYTIVRNYLKHKGHNIAESNEELIKDPNVIDKIQRELNSLNKSLGHWEQIKKFELTPEEWTVESGLLTPTLKLKRKVVKEKYIDLYNTLYPPIEE